MIDPVIDAPKGNPTLHDNAAQPAYWGGVFAMSLCVFALVASEFMPVSLLTPISGDLGITEGMAGQGIAISGAFAVLTSLLISTLIGTMDRKTLLLVLTVLMGVSGAIVALAPNYVHDWSCAHWRCNRGLLVYVGCNGDAVSTIQSGTQGFGYLQRWKRTSDRDRCPAR